MTDLTYHVKLLQFLKDNPVLERNPTQLRLNQNSALEERKDVQEDTSPLRAAEPAAEGEDENQSHLLNSPEAAPLLSPTMSERVSVAK